MRIRRLRFGSKLVNALDNSLYTDDIRQVVRSRNWPKSLIWEIVEFEDCLKFKLYRENINSLDHDNKLRLAGILNDTLNTIRDKGVPIYTWVAKGDGRNVNT